MILQILRKTLAGMVAQALRWLRMNLPGSRTTQREHADREELTERLARALPHDGRAEPLKGVHLTRFSTTHEKFYGIAQPCFCVTAQGSKEVFVADERHRYDPHTFLLGTVELPVVGRVLEASRTRPFLGLRLDLDPALVGSVMLEMAHAAPKNAGDTRAMAVSPLPAPLLDATLRLARLLDSPDEAHFLAPLVVREIVYRLWTGEQGGTLWRMARPGGHTQLVAQVVKQISRDLSQPLRVEEMARGIRMSVSSFHHHFKAVTAMSPLQFQKQLRLQEARRLLLNERHDAASAGFQVGYEDASHFNRDYKRLFGEPPMRDVERWRETALTGAGV